MGTGEDRHRYRIMGLVEKGIDEMTFEDVRSKVQGLPDTAMVQVPGALKEETKKKLSRKSPDEVAVIVTAAIDEINRGSILPLDTLIKQKL